MEKHDFVLEKIKDAYTEFKMDMLSKDVSELYENAYKISSIEEMFIILQNGYEFTEEMIKKILSFKGNILEQIYDEWIGSDVSYIEEFQDIIDKALTVLPER